MTPPTIATLAPSDAHRIVPLLAQVQQLHVAAHPDLFRGDAPDDEVAAFLRDWLSGEAMYALVASGEDGAALGYLIYEIRARPDSTIRRANRLGFLHHIAVDDAHRGQRIGSRLVEEMKGRLRRERIDALHSTYYVFNDASAALMRSAGLAPLQITVSGAI